MRKPLQQMADSWAAFPSPGPSAPSRFGAWGQETPSPHILESLLALYLVKPGYEVIPKCEKTDLTHSITCRGDRIQLAHEIMNFPTLPTRVADRC
jgi:hypothetical protein